MHSVLSRAGTFPKLNFSVMDIPPKKIGKNTGTLYFILVLIISLFAITLSLQIRRTLIMGHPHNTNAILGAIFSIEREYWTLQIQMSSACYSIYVYIYNYRAAAWNQPTMQSLCAHQDRNIRMHSIFLYCRICSENKQIQ